MAGLGKYIKGEKFTLKSGNNPAFNMMGSSPYNQNTPNGEKDTPNGEVEEKEGELKHGEEYSYYYPQRKGEIGVRQLVWPEIKKSTAREEAERSEFSHDDPHHGRL